jgi:hypothetical protein
MCLYQMNSPNINLTLIFFFGSILSRLFHSFSKFRSGHDAVHIRPFQLTFKYIITTA